MALRSRLTAVTISRLAEPTFKPSPGEFMSFHLFTGTDTYLVTPELRDAVNVACALEKPLLIRGEPGTGKTVLAEAIAENLDKRLLTWNIKSTTKAQDG